MSRLNKKTRICASGIEVPPIIFGTSYLGNLYKALSWEDKLDIIKAWFDNVECPVTIDTAGKYGAGLALEVIGKGLRELQVDPQDIIISNKLGWYRVPLKGSEPTFEKGVWEGLENDAVQKISYTGILECWEQGLELLGGGYQTRLLSVHDPDEYIEAAENEKDRNARMEDVLGAYRALLELKRDGKADAIGIGSKDWTMIRDVTDQVDLDWVMLATSFTIMEHPPELIKWIDSLAKRNIAIINSAVFHGGFLTGGDFFNYRKVDPNSSIDKPLFAWRDKFFGICEDHHVKPADACMKFGISHPAIISLALNTSRPEKIPDNIVLLERKQSEDFWQDMKTAGLIKNYYDYSINT